MHRRQLLTTIPLVPWVCVAQTRTAALVIRPERPFAYLEFDRVGARRPVTIEEKTQGIWIRFHNNCVYPIIVDAYHIDGTTSHVALCHGVVPVDPITSSRGHPTGYDTADVRTPLTIKPGGSVLFSVPADHVRPNWYVRVGFDFQMQRKPIGRSPLMFATFVWTDIPQDQQRVLRPQQ